MLLHASQSSAATVPRRARLDDMAAVARIHRLAFFRAMPHMPVLHTPEDDFAFYSSVVFPRTEIWMTEQSGTATGFIALRADWIDHLYIHPEHQRRGLGTSLLAVAQASADSLRLWTFQCNAGARQFYEEHGFRIEQETNGATNDERQPDILYVWQRGTVPNARNI